MHRSVFVSTSLPLERKFCMWTFGHPETPPSKVGGGGRCICQIIQGDSLHSDTEAGNSLVSVCNVTYSQHATCTCSKDASYIQLPNHHRKAGLKMPGGSMLPDRCHHTDWNQSGPALGLAKQATVAPVNVCYANSNMHADSGRACPTPQLPFRNGKQWKLTRYYTYWVFFSFVLFHFCKTALFVIISLVMTVHCLVLHCTWNTMLPQLGNIILKCSVVYSRTWPRVHNLAYCHANTLFTTAPLGTKPARKQWTYCKTLHTLSIFHRSFGVKSLPLALYRNKKVKVKVEVYGLLSGAKRRSPDYTQLPPGHLFIHRPSQLPGEHPAQLPFPLHRTIPTHEAFTVLPATYLLLGRDSARGHSALHRSTTSQHNSAQPGIEPVISPLVSRPHYNWAVTPQEYIWFCWITLTSSPGRQHLPYHCCFSSIDYQIAGILLG